MSQSPRRPALGRGLSALIPGADSASASAATSRSPLTLPLDQIHPAPHQPRTRFDDVHLAELTASIRADGLLQPILVRALGPQRYEIIAGERRYRASKAAGLSEVPVVVREVSDAKAFELALVENVQREDLDPIEEADAYRHLADTYGMTQEQIAQRVGKDRATVANALRLLKLPDGVRRALVGGELTAGHARALLTAPDDDRQALAEIAIAQGWSVRETERRARAVRDG
ncbi:MAG: ParB/RepB/Spo0J family partition protein, partial [Myxococcales bacterium]|nr:ParB/RepB/Spo0J family partition protein [Myxococcales bacterium]